MCIICQHDHKDSNSKLHSIEEIYYLDCPTITIIPSCLKKIKTLVCINCPNLIEISYLRSLKRLVCKNCPKLTKISLIKGMRELTVEGCRMVTSIPQDSRKHSYGIKNLHKLRVLDCYWTEIETPACYNGKGCLLVT